MVGVARVSGFGTLLAALSFILLGTTSAQEKDKAKGKVDPKAAEKKDDKGEAKKDDEKPNPFLDEKDPKKKEEKPGEEKVVYGQSLRAKIKRFDANSDRYFSIEVPTPDPKRVYDLNVWKAQQLNSIANDRNFANRANRIRQYQLDLARRQNDVFVMQEIELQAAEDIRVRTNFPPVVYDDKGFLKKWTVAELRKLRGNSKLPGYPTEFDSLRPGQVVSVYLAKPDPKAAPKKKDLLGGVPEPGLEINRPKVVMILIEQEAMLRP